MPRQITPRPAKIPTPPEVIRQHIDDVMVEMGLDVNGDIDPSKCFISFKVLDIDSGGMRRASVSRRYPSGQWPPALRRRIIDLRNAIMALSEQAGDLEPGTDAGELDDGSSP